MDRRRASASNAPRAAGEPPRKRRATATPIQSVEVVRLAMRMGRNEAAHRSQMKEQAQRAEQKTRKFGLLAAAKLEKITKERDELKKQVNERSEGLKETEQISEELQNDSGQKNKTKLEAAMARIKALEKERDKEARERANAVEEKEALRKNHGEQLKKIANECRELRDKQAEAFQEYQKTVEYEVLKQKRMLAEKTAVLEIEAKMNILAVMKNNVESLFLPPQ